MITLWWRLRVAYALAEPLTLAIILAFAIFMLGSALIAMTVPHAPPSCPAPLGRTWMPAAGRPTHC